MHLFTLRMFHPVLRPRIDLHEFRSFKAQIQTLLSGAKPVWIVRISCFLRYCCFKVVGHSRLLSCHVQYLHWRRYLLWTTLHFIKRLQFVCSALLFHCIAQIIKCDNHYLCHFSNLSVANKNDILETSLHFPVYFQTAFAMAWYEQRVCFPPACILLLFKALRLRRKKKSSLRDRIKREGVGGKG